MTDYNLLVTPRRSAIAPASATEVDVLVRLQAPDAPPAGTPQRRHALDIACVIDRSGSMDGVPLDEAKRCVMAMIASLKATDRAACVVYDDHVQVLVANRPVGDASAFRHALASVTSGGMTNLHGGWLAGAKELADALHGDDVARVILLSDGNANAGLTDADTIAAQCAQLAAAGVTTSTYGLGHHFNEDLMIAMAEKGGGNHYYGETAADLMEPFRQEFDLLQDLAARQVTLRVVARAGVSVRVMNDYPRAGADTHRLPDIAYGSEAWALVRLRLTPGDLNPAARSGQISLVDLEVELRDAQSGERRFLRSSLTLPIVDAEVLPALPQNELVASRVRELESAALHMQIREAVRNGDWATAERLLAAAELEAADHPWLMEMLATVRRFMHARDSAGLAKESAFASSRMRSRLTEKNEVSDVNFSVSEELAKPSFLRRKSQQGRRQVDPEGGPD